MTRVIVTAEEVKKWIGGDAVKEGLLIREAPIGRSTLTAFLLGNYQPSPRLAKAMLGVMEQYPDEVTVTGGTAVG